jgi:hypothetical protein
MKQAITIILITIMLFVSNQTTKAQSGILVGVLLNQLMDRVENSIRLAENAGKGIIIQGGSTLYLSIENAKIAYAESLDKTFEKVDQSTQGTINQLTALTTKLEKQSIDDVNDIISQSQTIINSLPFSNKQPQVGKFTPNYVAPSDQTYQVAIEIRGNFIYASKEDYKPKLVVNSKTFETVQNTTQSLKFLVPVGDLAPKFDNTFNYTSGELTVPFKTGFIFSKRKEAKYKILIGILPSSPGVVKIKHKVSNSIHEEQRKSTQRWEQHSSNDDLTWTRCSEGFPGWHIKDPAFIVEWSQGNENDQWSKSLTSTNPQVCYEVHTVHHGIGTSGKVNYHFDFTIERDRNEETWVEEPVNLKWGESKNFNYAPGSWVVTIDSFDGKHNEYGTTASDNYIEVNGSTTAIQIQIKKAGQVTYP